MAKKKQDAHELAAEYGFALSVLRSEPSLRKLFERAVDHTYTPARFIAELRDTKWFKHHSEPARQAMVLRKTDPATWKDKVLETNHSIRDMADQLGAVISDKAIQRISTNVLTYGWNDNKIRDVLAGTVKASGAGTFHGEAAVNAEQLRKMALDNGINIAKDQMSSWVRRLAEGEDMGTFTDYMQNVAASAFPTFSKDILGGTTVRQIADPYVNSMAKILEMNSEDIDMFDPTIRKALASTDETGKPASKPLWQFEQDLRKDPRWLKTQNAQDSLMGAGVSILQRFGLF